MTQALPVRTGRAGALQRWRGSVPVPAGAAGAASWRQVAALLHAAHAVRMHACTHPPCAGRTQTRTRMTLRWAVMGCDGQGRRLRCTTAREGVHQGCGWQPAPPPLLPPHQPCATLTCCPAHPPIIVLWFVRQAKEKFQKLGEAFQVLGNPELRWAAGGSSRE